MKLSLRIGNSHEGVGLLKSNSCGSSMTCFSSSLSSTFARSYSHSSLVKIKRPKNPEFKRTY